MLLESRRVRSWLSQPAVAASGRHPDEIVEPVSAGFSFNPFPGEPSFLFFSFFFS